MNSEHVEVLRKMKGWRMPPIDGSAYNAALDAAIAALSDPAEVQPVDQIFAEWLASEMPAGTVIGDPAWWAGRIARQFAKRNLPPSTPVGADESNLMARLDAIHRQVFGKPYPAPVGVAEAMERAAEEIERYGHQYISTVGASRVIRKHMAALAQQPAAFRNDGNSEAEFIADDANACTACGGSVHQDDQQPAAEVYVDFPQVGTAGPLAVVDGKVTLPGTTMNDLIRHARTGYVEQPAAVDEVQELARWVLETVTHDEECDAMTTFGDDPGKRCTCGCSNAFAKCERILAGQQGGSDNDR